MPKDAEWVFEKAIDLTAATMGGRAGQGQGPEFASQVFRELWSTLKDASQELGDKARPGF
jgi:hypothetical protein